MPLSDWLIDPREPWPATDGCARTIGLVDFAALPGDASIAPLPPFPLVGLGDLSHPLAPMFDALIEPPISAEALIANVRRAPQAAAVAVRLLRAVEAIPIDRALTAESLAYGRLQGGEEHDAWLSARKRSTPQAAGVVGVEREGAVLRVTLDRPWALNAIDNGLRDGLYEAFDLAALDPSIETVLLRGVGRAFGMGGDLDEFGTTRDPATAHAIRAQTLPALPLSRCTEKVEVHVHGACVGSGLEIAAFARRVTASPSAWFQLPELAMGLIPGAGGCVSVSRRIGRQRAVLMILSGKRITAATALGWGLIDAIEDLPPIDESGAHPDR